VTNIICHLSLIGFQPNSLAAINALLNASEVLKKLYFCSLTKFMDNKINEIRRKISALRAKMLGAEDSIRDRINHDLDCTESSIQLMAMRREMVSLIRERDALGGREECPNIAERLRENYRPARKVLGKWS
jgi:hypothetical protein